MSNILYTYGTLRPGNGNTELVKGALYDLGWFPGIRLGGTTDVVCEPVEIDDWGGADRYEGYDPEDPAGSLYIRVPYKDGYIYEFNSQVAEEKLIASGDWLLHKKDKRGVYADRFARS